MSRLKGDPARGKPITLPQWWLAALNRRCGDRPRREITDELNAASKRQPPFGLSAVYDFLAGKVTTDVMMGAFLVLFPDLPPPVFYASSEDEARRFQQLARLYSTPVERQPAHRVDETIEDTSESTRARETSETSEKTRTRKRAK